MKRDDIKQLIPSKYKEEEKEKIVILLIELAEIYLKTEEIAD